MRIPTSSPDLTEAEVRAVVQVLSTRYLSLGLRLAAFEHALVADRGWSGGCVQ